jgi:UV DNA damage repair endonuclease
MSMTLPSKFRSVTRKHYKGIPHLLDVYRNNLEHLYNLLVLCKNNSWGLRISSSLMPLVTHPEIDVNRDDASLDDTLMNLFSM